MPKTLLTGKEDETVTIRKIENGFIVRQSFVKSTDKDGFKRFEEREFFTDDPKKLPL